MPWKDFIIIIIIMFRQSKSKTILIKILIGWHIYIYNILDHGPYHLNLNLAYICQPINIWIKIVLLFFLVQSNIFY